MSGAYLFTKLEFRDGFRGGFQGAFGVRIFESPHARESKTVLDSGFHAVDFRIPGTRFLIFFHWNSDFGFHLLVGFRIPKTRISFSTGEFVPDFEFLKQNFPSLHGVIRVIRIMLP